MPKTKNRRWRRKTIAKRRTMKPRTFETAKSARRYLNRFRYQFRSSGKYHRSVVETVMSAMRKLKV